jgi:hypothetical protein
MMHFTILMLEAAFECINTYYLRPVQRIVVARSCPTLQIYDDGLILADLAPLADPAPVPGSGRGPTSAGKPASVALQVVVLVAPLVAVSEIPVAALVAPLVAASEIPVVGGLGSVLQAPALASVMVLALEVSALASVSVALASGLEPAQTDSLSQPFSPGQYQT